MTEHNYFNKLLIFPDYDQSWKGLLLEWILQNQAVHLMLFTQQKSYHFYTIEILFQTVKEASNVKLVCTPRTRIIAPIHIH